MKVGCRQLRSLKQGSPPFSYISAARPSTYAARQCANKHMDEKRDRSSGHARRRWVSFLLFPFLFPTYFQCVVPLFENVNVFPLLLLRSSSASRQHKERLMQERLYVLTRDDKFPLHRDIMSLGICLGDGIVRVPR